MAEENSNPESELSPEEQQKQQSDKVTKKFDAAFKKLVALMGGDKNLKKVSIPTSEVGEVVEELLKERRKAKIEEFKKGAIAVLDKKIEFDKEVRKAEDQLKNTVIQKKKEFTEEMTKLFVNFESINEIEKAYNDNLKAAQSGGATTAAGNQG